MLQSLTLRHLKAISWTVLASSWPFQALTQHHTSCFALVSASSYVSCISDLSTTALSEKRNTRIYSTSTVASKFAGFESSWLERVGNIAREGVQNMHHWSGWTETATENGVGQAGWCRHCGSHSSVASLIAPDRCVLDTPSLAILVILSTCSYQLNSNLANLEATVEVE